MKDDGLSKVDAVAAEIPSGNRSVAVRHLLAMGLAAWEFGARSPAEVARAVKGTGSHR